jgi:hypothetical protein
MGLPNTLAGLVGMIIFIVFIVSIAASDVYPDQTQGITSAQNNFINNLNSSVNTTVPNQGFWGTILGLTGLDGVYNFITNFFSMIVSFIILVGGYILLLFGIATTIPVEFAVFFVLIASSGIIYVLKLIFMSGD